MIKVNQVKIIDQIQFHGQTSKLVKNKGKPIVNQLPDFSIIKEDKKWEIPSAKLTDQQKAQRNQAQQRSIVQQMEIQSQIIKTIQQVEQKIDLIPISKVNCQQDIEEFEKGVEIMERRMDEEMR